jgi:hypothetical protein
LNTSPKVVALPSTGLANDNAQVAAELRRFADEVEHGEWGDVDTTVLVIEADGAVQRQTFGKPCDRARVVGLLTWATHLAITPDG